MKRAAAYLRVSTPGQVGDDKFGLTIQADTIHKYASQIDMVVIETFTDQISGTKISRTGLNQLLEAHQNYDAIIISHTTRLARRMGASFAVLGELIETGSEIHAANMGVVDMNDDESATRFGFESLFSDLEHRGISKRLSAGIIAKVNAGKPATLLGAYGWHKGVQVPEEVARVQWIFEQVETRSLAHIALELNQKGIPTPSGKGRWQNSNLLSLVRNTVYRGEYQYGRKRKHRPGTRGRAMCAVPALVSLEQWERSNRALDSRMRNRRQTGVRRDTFPLMGRIKCGVCGGAMSGFQSSNRIGARLHYYKCWRSVATKTLTTCEHKRLYHAEKVHTLIRTRLKVLSLDLAALQSAIKQPAPVKLDLKPDRDRLKRRLENAIKMRSDGEITRAELEKIRGETEQALKGLEEQQRAPTPPVIDAKALQTKLKKVLQGQPLHEIADLLQLTITVHPDGSSGKQKALAGIYTLEIGV